MRGVVVLTAPGPGVIYATTGRTDWAVVCFVILQFNVVINGLAGAAVAANNYHHHKYPTKPGFCSPLLGIVLGVLGLQPLRAAAVFVCNDNSRVLNDAESSVLLMTGFHSVHSCFQSIPLALLQAYALCHACLTDEPTDYSTAEWRWLWVSLFLSTFCAAQQVYRFRIAGLPRMQLEREGSLRMFQVHRMFDGSWRCVLWLETVFETGTTVLTTAVFCVTFSWLTAPVLCAMVLCIGAIISCYGRISDTTYIATAWICLINLVAVHAPLTGCRTDLGQLSTAAAGACVVIKATSIVIMVAMPAVANADWINNMQDSMPDSDFCSDWFFVALASGWCLILLLLIAMKCHDAASNEGAAVTEQQPTIPTLYKLMVSCSEHTAAACLAPVLAKESDDNFNMAEFISSQDRFLASAMMNIACERALAGY